VSVVTEAGDQFGRTVVRFAEDGPVLWYESADTDGAFDELCHLLEGY